jgi:hypothetical protein
VKRTLFTALPLALALAACGGSSSRDVVRDASENLSGIRSGVLHAKFLVQPRGEGEPYGFTIDGPFRFGDEPTANVTYVGIANGRRHTTKLVIRPNGGSVVTDGDRRTLGRSELNRLRQTLQGFRAELRDAVKQATYFVMVGKDDKLLRALRVDLELAADVPEALRGLLGRLIAANARFELALDRPRR